MGIALLSGGGGAGLRAATDLSLPIEDAAMIKQAADLDIEQRRYLTYLYARLNKPKVATAIGESILMENPSDRQTLLVLASMATEQRDGEAAVQLAERYLRFYPGDNQGRYFLGAGYYLQRRFVQSANVLRELKREQYAHRRYPYETDLASASASAGQWYRAMLSYQSLLRHHELGDELRDEVREALDRIYREHGPHVAAAWRGVVLDNGEVWRTEASHAMHLNDLHWWTVAGHEDRVAIESVPGLRSRTVRRADAEMGVRSRWNARWTTEAGLGHGGAGWMSEVRARYTFAPSRTVEFGTWWNERATDSLVLESLNGRQDWTGLTASWQLEADLSLGIKAGMREVYVAGTRLGQGDGIEVSLDQTLRRHGPQWIVGYRGAVASFNTGATDLTLVDPTVRPGLPPGGRRAVLNNLVSPRINRHGMGWTLTDNLADAWSYRLTVGGDYDFVLDSLGFNAGVAGMFRPRKSIEIQGELGYSSNASASNAGNEAVLLNLSFRFHY
ncbi:tetratricopeptide repeat protein [Synoicihabitans lomoniglobus]|uniref:Uncharacterized protein n=1 Tax=Synoicihabitans lomoniglobus TaxID=2909285 RepID=A0AAF0CQD2_9BACT|nr:hypothetical protein [Opitutaceae bacterium LMO-M01]WED66123.1 hypothetical protein PXH66_04600 [Opitutaceae bacterium LMO-M01]